MTREQKDLLIKDLSARLPYGVKIRVEYPFIEEKDWYPEDLHGLDLRKEVHAGTSVRIEEFKPYLRPMSSMTEEEKKDLLNYVVGKDSKYFEVCDDVSITDKSSDVQDVKSFELKWINFNPNTTSRYIEWLLKNHFDYRGLIEKGLALEAPEGMYN